MSLLLNLTILFSYTDRLSDWIWQPTFFFDIFGFNVSSGATKAIIIIMGVLTLLFDLFMFAIVMSSKVWSNFWKFKHLKNELERKESENILVHKKRGFKAWRERIKAWCSNGFKFIKEVIIDFEMLY